MAGSMRTCVTDTRTDGAGYIGPADRQGGSKNRSKQKKDCAMGETLVTYEVNLINFRQFFFIYLWASINVMISKLTLINDH